MLNYIFSNPLLLLFYLAIPILVLIATIFFDKKNKTSIARYYIIISVGFLFFGRGVFWIAFIILIFSFIKDKTKPKKLEVVNKKV